MSQPVSLGYGKINFDNMSATLTAFVIEPGFVRNFPSKKFSRRGRAQSFPCSQYPDINGTLMLDTLEIPDGVVICLQASQRRNAIAMRDGAVFIRIREQGPMLVVNASIPIHRESLIGTSHLVFQGRGDLMSLDDLAESGSTPTNGWIQGFMDSEEIIQCFDIRELDSEQAPAPKLERIVNMSGNTVTLQSAIPSRRIRVR